MLMSCVLSYTPHLNSKVKNIYNNKKVLLTPYNGPGHSLLRNPISNLFIKIVKIFKQTI